MCGISGIYVSKKNTLDKLKLDESVDRLERRGPDARGVWYSPENKVGLGHRRLSIIDVSSVANQPMITSDNTVVIVFNGEIFNFKALREELEQKFYVFNTHSDTEVLLNLYHCFGDKAWIKLNGFFALAVYHLPSKKLTLVRDRFGIKPLYYSLFDGNLVFGSEMKALFPLGIEKRIDFEALKLYFSFNYIPAPHSIFQGVQKLLPGEYLSFDGENCLKQKYYDLTQATEEISNTLDYEQAKQKLYELMDQSVCDRLVSDVPIGTFLSGGIDSSVITALASNQKESINTFSVGFKDNKFFDETKYARLVAEKYKTNHQEIILSNDDLLLSLEELLDYTDEPFADSSALAVNALCKETRKKVTVCLSGDGADEVFGGYNKYMAEYKIQHLGFSEKSIAALAPLWKVLPKSRNNPITNTFRKLDKFSQGTLRSKKERYLDWCAIGNRSVIDRLLLVDSPDFDTNLAGLAAHILDRDGMNDIFMNDIHLVLPNDMLTKVDSMSMRNSLEVRVPFLDYRVVEFACGLPESYKINGSLKKRIVQDTFRTILPSELYNRPKHGFEVPMLEWLRKDLKVKIEEVYLSEELIKSQKIFNYNTVKELWTKLNSNNPEDSHATIWALVVFQHWYLSYLS